MVTSVVYTKTHVAQSLSLPPADADQEVLVMGENSSASESASTEDVDAAAGSSGNQQESPPRSPKIDVHFSCQSLSIMPQVLLQSTLFACLS